MTAIALSDRQSRFVEEYLVDSNGAAAAVRAGYAPGASAKVAASRLLSNDNPVKRAIQTRQSVDARRLSIRRDDVLNGLLEAAEMARQQANPTALVSALREVGRMLGYYEPRTVNVDVNLAPTSYVRRMEAKMQL